MTRFDGAAAIVIGSEGPRSNDPGDAGGLTVYGHDSASWPDLLARVPAVVRHALPEQVDDLTPDTARLAYRAGYWSIVRGDDLPAPLALALFDAAVNQGLGWAPAAFQSVLGVAVDGDVGPMTVAAANGADTLTTLGEFSYRRLLRYRQAGNYGTFGHGWETRAIRVAALAPVYDLPAAARLTAPGQPHVGVPRR